MTQRTGLTEIIVIQDRSGSMVSNRVETEGGINRFIDDQKNEPGEAVLTFAEFDDEYDIIHKGVNIKDVPPYNLRPRGLTRLHDAIGKTLSTAKQRIDRLSGWDKPELVIVAIVTDGGENNSREYNGEQIKKMIADCEKEGWQFTYIGANQDAFAEARNIGLKANVVLDWDVSRAGAAYASLSSNVTRMRSMHSAGHVATSMYTSAERAQAKESNSG